ncbi:MAG: type II toxin-antitoxin system VapC family toxin [Chloroflexota bacterium]|nr:type II toxin-antitoxin system VapC family toxin [Chloroflexota bacterium]MDE2958755.1 type II toxin-antitoxin system VapC family toxin [Chloroflexota bacterium]
MHLLDTNIVSELRRRRPDPAVMRWIERIPHDQLFLSAVTIGEIQAGVEITREQDLAKAIEIETWLVELMDSYNVLPMDAPTFREWARLQHGRSNTLAADAMIAATAIVNELVVVTRSVRDSEQFDVELLNPFVSQ